MAVIQNGNPIHGSGVIQGAQLPTFRNSTTITNAQMLNLFAQPVVIVPAAGEGNALIFEGISIFKPSGSAYAVGAGVDLSIKYTDAAGLELGQCETMGFLNISDAQQRWTFWRRPDTGDSAIAIKANEPLVLHMLVDEATSGTVDIEVEVHYRVVKSGV